MKYTIQLHTESGSFSAPDGKDVKHARSRAEIRGLLEQWVDTVTRYGDAPCSALVWRGHLEDVTDVYPDAEATLGKRGGFHLTLG
jgi:hypothetical protein